MGPLRNPRHEQFAQCIAAGQPKYKACAHAYGRPLEGKTLRANGSRLWLHLESSPRIRARVNELMTQRRKAADLTYDDLLNETLLNIDLAREAGQHAAAFKGLAMLGSEMFQAFVEKRETNINLDVKITSKAALRAALVTEYGEELASAIWQRWSAPKMIEHDGASHDDVALDAEPERGQVDNSAKTAKLALQSIADSQAPKLK